MKKTVLHHCECLNKNFTRKQWIEWTKNHHSDFVVFSYNGYNYNIYDVCLNPDEAVKQRIGKTSFVIQIAQKPNGNWIYGFHYDTYNGGGGFLPSYYIKGEKTRNECICAALDKLKDRLGNHADNKVFDRIRELKGKYKAVELSLFDF